MVSDNSRKNLPPYVSYRTFCNFLAGLQQQVPSRIDRSFWGDMFSGSTGTQLVAALRFLGLIDVNGKPTLRLKSLASSTGETRAKLLREITTETYSFALNGPLEVQNATYAQLAEVFNSSFQQADDVRRKCIKFFISIASDAGIPLSPFITKKSRMTHTSSSTKSAIKKSGIRTNRNIQIPSDIPKTPDGPWYEILLGKFPAFDPAWNDEVKLKWFAAFDELLKRFSPQ